MPLTRRSLLKGIAGAGAGLGAACGEARAEPREAPADAVGMLYDTTRCIGCKACVVACRKANGLEADRSGDPEGLHDAPLRLSATTKNIIKLHDDGETRSFMKSQCMHCVDPSCVGACMLGALQKREFGIVWWDESKCVGCRYCQMACPYNVPQFEWQSRNPRIVKCEMCRHLIAEGGTPACCDVCPKEAVVYGRRSELLAEAHRRLAAHPERYVNKVYGEHDGGGTQVLYLSHVPFEKLGLPALGDHAQAETVRAIQHGVLRWALPPVLLLTLAGAAVGRRRARREEEGGES
jgi:Fe-S-cluster-containing dehydrogenase component